MSQADLKRARVAARSWATRASNSLEDICGTEDINVNELQEAIDEIDKRIAILDGAQSEYEMSLIDETELVNDIENAGIIRDNLRCNRLKGTSLLNKLKTANRSIEGADDGSVRSYTSTISTARLPKLELPKFNGEPSKWPEFWGQFKANIHTADLPVITKFSYLQSLLNGDAKAAIQGMSLTADNYSIAVSLLERRFGRKENIVFSHIQHLLNIETPKGSSVTQLWKLRDNVMTHVRCLENLDIHGSQYGVILTPLILSRLPDDIRMAWARDGEGHESDLDYLLTFMEKEIRCRERSQTYQTSTNGVGFGVKQEQKRGQNTAVALYSGSSRPNNTKNTPQCAICSKRHDTECCWGLTKGTLTERREKIRQHKLCFKCLSDRHFSKQCSSKCSKCQGAHHKLLCESDSKDASVNEPENKVANNSSSSNSSKTAAALYSANVHQNVVHTALPLCKVMINDIPATMLFDSGADKSFVSSTLVKKAKPKFLHKEMVQFASFGGGKSQNSLKNVYSLSAKGTKQGECNIIATEVPNICAPMIRPSVPQSKLECFGNIEFVESGIQENVPTVVDIIIGQDQYWKFVRGGVIRGEDDLVALESLFGWLVTGSWLVPVGTTNVQCMSLQLFSGGLSDISEFSLKNFWDLESIGISPKETGDEIVDIPVVHQFNESIKFDDGRYTVSLPWNSKKSELLNNRNVAFHRLNALTKRLDNNPELSKAYNEVFQQYVNEGFIEEVPSKNVTKPIYYMPHRPVIKESSSTTKVRPVFDASSPCSNGVSLNSCVEAGPPMINSLIEILLRFRRWKVALSADISKAFLQIKLNESDRDVHRFLWNDSGNVREMRFTRVPFGNKSSPFLLNATLKHHLNKYENSTTISELLDNLYVDDWLSGADCDEDASHRYTEAKGIIGEAGMVLAKWNTNSMNVHSKFISDFGEKQTGASSLKVLGSGWDPLNDSFIFSENDILTSTEMLSCTKRLVLSLIARMFDPLGFLSPITMFAKFILQELWCAGIDWDESVPTPQQEKFDLWVEGLKSLSQIKIPRCYEGLGKWKDTLECIEFHAFCDASEKGYGAVIYCRVTYGDGFRVSFVTSKGKVAPLKKVTLPRLELLGALLCARLLVFVLKALKLDMGSVPVYCWSDSMVALGWIKGDPGRWKPFVANRVREIQDLTSPNVWRHCDGVDNPADIVSRGAIGDKLALSSLWWNGPEWLSTKEVFIDKPSVNHKLPSEEHIVLLVSSPPPEVFPVSRYGTLEKAVRVIGWVLRFIHNIRHKMSRKTGSLSCHEISHAKLMLLKQTQTVSYHSELNCLKEDIPIKKDSPLFQLMPVLGNDGLLRVGGRLERSALEYEEKHPIILPKCHLSTLIVQSQHFQNKHAGVDTMVTMLRCSFWIFGLRTMAKQVKRKCVKCRIIDAPPCNQICGPLPKLRVNEAPPFTITGMDYAGPLYVREFPDHKFYVLLFTCAVVRAIHLELVDSLSVDECIKAIRRFSARRGSVKTFYSDNAKTFVGVSKVFSAKFGISCPDWKFIAPRSPWWGGWWERLVRTVKSSLRKSVGMDNLSRSELETYLIEIEACVNSRPLTFVGTEVDSLSPLTPSHFLIGRSSGFSMEVSEDNSNSVDVNAVKLREKYDIMQQRLDIFWSRWSNDYLKNLPTSVRGSKVCGKIEYGSVVLIREDNTPRLKWPMGLVVETYPGEDKVVRTVLLKTAKGKIVRSVQRLHDLEIVHHSEPENKSSEPESKSAKKNVSNNEKHVSNVSQNQTTRSGRVIKKNRRFNDYDTS